MWTRDLDWGLTDFSGYIAVDELYDGPLCVLAIVDNHTCKRLLYQVLDHDPDHQDITAFLRRFRMALQRRGVAWRGVTTDGSPLYPAPLRAVFGEVPHQICEFHILKELTKAILRAVAQVRKDLATRKPPSKRGRPATPAAQRAVRQRGRLQQKIGELFAQRYLFVQHDLTPGICWQILAGTERRLVDFDPPGFQRPGDVIKLQIAGKGAHPLLLIPG